MEVEGDDVPWKQDLLTQRCGPRNGRFEVPSRPGWGSEIDEQAVRAHPWTPAP